MDDPHRPGESAPADPEAEERVLRAKYLDYCSAQLADLLLYLSPDEIFLLAEKAARDRGESSAGTYSDMVEVATGWLGERVSLPPFHVWVEDYRKDPERYDRYLMGLWRSEPGSGTGSTGSH
jgi:hypothetical protein